MSNATAAVADSIRSLSDSELVDIFFRAREAAGAPPDVSDAPPEQKPEQKPKPKPKAKPKASMSREDMVQDETVRSILLFLRDNPDGVSATKVAKHLGVETPEAAATLKDMVVNDLARKTGQRRGTKYHLPAAPDGD